MTAMAPPFLSSCFLYPSVLFRIREKFAISRNGRDISAKFEITSLMAANRWVSVGFTFMAIFIRAMTAVITMHDQPRIWKDWKESGPLYRMSSCTPCSWSFTRFFAMENTPSRTDAV